MRRISLAAVAAAASSDFRFLALHHTPFTAIKARQTAAQGVAARLMPLLKKYNVQAVFSGHDHNFQHHRSEGIEFIVTGGGGAPLYDLDAPIALRLDTPLVPATLVCVNLRLLARSLDMHFRRSWWNWQGK